MFNLEYIIIIAVFLVILLAILKSMKKDAHIELNKLVEYLGGKDNIIKTETSLSRFKVTLKDVALVNKEAIQKLGAKGIVEIDNQLKIILGSESKQLKKYIDSLKQYPYATQYDKGDCILDRKDIELLEIFISGLVNK